MVLATTLGFPRIGPKRELKKALEKYWSGAVTESELDEVSRTIRQNNWRLQKEVGIDHIPSNEFSLYDHVLDTAAMVVDGTISNPSDARLKEQIRPLSYGLSELLRLQPVTWKWKAEPEGRRQLGLVAQEVEHVLPEVVQHDPDPDRPLGLNYVGLMPVTIKAIQEQQSLIEDQHKRLTEQQEQLEQRGRQIEELKELVCLDHPQAAVCK